MGIFNRMLGNAGEVNLKDVESEINPLLIEGESIHRVFKTIRDLYVFTTKRLIFIDKQGITGSKIEYLTIPYKNISLYSLETAGTFDLDADLKIWVSGYASSPITQKIAKGCNVAELQKELANFILK